MCGWLTKHTAEGLTQLYEPFRLVHVIQLPSDISWIPDTDFTNVYIKLYVKTLYCGPQAVHCTKTTYCH